MSPDARCNQVWQVKKTFSPQFSAAARERWLPNSAALVFEMGAISYNYNDYGKYWALKSRTWSRKSMNFWASLPQRLLASVILDGEVKSDWTSERHSLDVISVERILVQN